MLITCPECGLSISDKAHYCPHCGLPRLKSPVKRSKKRMKLPNGFGQISEIRNKNLRNPYRVMVTVGHTDQGRPIARLLKPKAYFATYNDAYAALVKYNKDPYDLDRDLTFKELYEQWSEIQFQKYNSTKGVYTMAFNHCTSLHNKKISEIKVKNLKDCLDCETSKSMRQMIKAMFNLMYDYAIECEYTDKNLAKNINMRTLAPGEKKKKTIHKAFSEEELAEIAKYNEPIAELLLFQCYSGWRPKELLELRTENINLEERTMTGGCKTEAGIERTIPIHDRIYPIAKKYKELNNLRLFESEFPSYSRLKRHLDKFCENITISPHLPHDGRKTFVTRAKKYNVNDYAIKHIVGHHIDDLTEATYTERDIKWLKTEINKIL